MMLFGRLGACQSAQSAEMQWSITGIHASAQQVHIQILALHRKVYCWARTARLRSKELLDKSVADNVMQHHA
jgi:hypothetical protein